ncbi:MAG: cytochrome-c peroxidase [Bacteroidota bacterium]
MNRILLPLLILGALFSCAEPSSLETPLIYDQEDPYRPELMKKAQEVFQSVTPREYTPNPYEKVQLGKMLYFDNRLSKDGNISCNSCHNLETFGVDNLPTSPGDTHELGGRNSPTTLYAYMHRQQFWDGRAKDVEEQAGMPILNPVEHNIPSEEFLVDRLRSIPAYVEKFAKVYGEQTHETLTFDHIGDAIGAFERRLNPRSRFDEYLDGNDEMLTALEKEGLTLFMNEGCTTCHSGVALGGGMIQKFGIYQDYWELTGSETIDNGLYDITKNESDRYLFKSPSLRNIAQTYPYFHDGSVESLPDAVQIMAQTQLGKELEEEKVEKIVAFLKSLTAAPDEELIAIKK